MTQAAVQDVVWLDDEALAILKSGFSAYFVNSGQLADADTTRFYVVMPLTTEFRGRFEAAWRRLTKVESFKLRLSQLDDKAEGLWYV